MFVMYCVNEESGSSLLIESTDSMIYNIYYRMSGFLVLWEVPNVKWCQHAMCKHNQIIEVQRSC